MDVLEEYEDRDQEKADILTEALDALEDVGEAVEEALEEK